MCKAASSCCIRHELSVCQRGKTHSSFCTRNYCCLDVNKQWQPKQTAVKKLLTVLEPVHSGNTLSAITLQLFDILTWHLAHILLSIMATNFEIWSAIKQIVQHVQTQKSTYPEEGSPSIICVINHLLFVKRNNVIM